MGVSSDGGGADAATTLCTSCGLCCTGAMHHSVLLRDDEVEAATALGLEVSNQGRPVFALPCPHLDGTRCSVFDRRPGACGEYRCQLLQELDQGRTDLSGALEKVRVARTRLGEVLASLPPNMNLRQARAIVTGREANAMANPDLRLKLIALIYYLDRHFMNEDDGKYFVVSDVSPTGETR